MNGDRLLLLTPLRQALERIERSWTAKTGRTPLCQEALPAGLDAIRSLEQQASEGR